MARASEIVVCFVSFGPKNPNSHVCVRVEFVLVFEGHEPAKT